MTTATEILEASLQRLVVAGAEASIAAPDSSKFIFRLNNHMNTLIGGGVTITWTTITNIGDTIVVMDQADTPVDISAYCIQYLELKMAELMAADYGDSITPDQYKEMRAGKRSMLKKSRKGTHIKYPTILPKGSGNQDGVFLDDHFYDGATAGESPTT